MVHHVEGGIQLQGHDEDTTPIWHDVTDSEEQVKLMLETNADHLRQAAANGTPFAAELLVELFRFYGTHVNIDEVLNGELIIEDIPVLEEIMVCLDEIGYGNFPTRR